MRSTAPFAVAVALLAACATPKAPAPPAFEDVAAPDASTAPASAGGPQFYDAAEAPVALPAPDAAPPKLAGSRDDGGAATTRRWRHRSDLGPWTDSVAIAGNEAGVSADDVLALQVRVHPQIDQCIYRMLHRRGGAQSGTVAYVVSLDGRGTVRDVTVGRDDVGDSIYAACIGEILRGLTWPSAKGAGGALTLAFGVATS